MEREVQGETTQKKQTLSFNENGSDKTRYKDLDTTLDTKFSGKSFQGPFPSLPRNENPDNSFFGSTK